MKEPERISKPKILLGEGKDEQRVFAAMVAHVGLSDQVQVLGYEGKENLRKYLAALPKFSGFSQVVPLGVTRDADTDAGRARQSVDDALRAAKIPPQVRTSVSVVPGDDRAGALEDLCCDALRGLPVWPCVEQFVECRVGSIGEWPNTAANRGKARVEAWLSTLDHPTTRLGEAADRALLPFDSPAFAKLLTFIRSL